MEDYTKYRWFFTKSGKLVVGGKSAENNDELLRLILTFGKVYYIMHTSHPGSPFSVIISDNVSKKDIEEAAIFTGCFSRAWKENKKQTEVHLFSSNQLYKDKRMKSGTWGVTGKIEKIKVNLELVLTKQKEKYRAVPSQTAPKEDILLTIKPGKTQKEKKIDEILEVLKETKSKKDELLAALPAGGIEWKKQNFR